MKLATIGMLSAAVLLAGASIAGAQSTMSPSSPSAAPQDKCWNAATNTVQDKAAQAPSGQKKSGGVTTGSGTSGNAINSTGSQLQTRPAGMPSC
jgi:hypothetical protein